MVGLSGAAAQENYQHLSLHTSQQHESIAKGILGKLFSPYTAIGAKIGAPSCAGSCTRYEDLKIISSHLIWLILLDRVNA